MYEKVNPSSPDKLADRIAGSIVDLAYKKEKNPTVDVEVLIGYGKCHIINETNCHISKREVKKIVKRIVPDVKIKIDYVEVKQDENLALNQMSSIHCGDNGIFKAVPITNEQKELTDIAKYIYQWYPTDGKYILDSKLKRLVICQSNTKYNFKNEFADKYEDLVVNPLGFWTGSDTGATNRKLSSDMGDSITGGGIHGKDLSKPDVSVNIYCHLIAEKTNQVVVANCAIGNETVIVKIGKAVPIRVNFKEIVEEARQYIEKIGGFEKLAEWGLIR